MTKKDPELAGQCFDIETDEGGQLILCLKPERDHYIPVVTDAATGRDVLDILHDQPIPPIYTIDDVNYAIAVLFSDQSKVPEITSDTEISDWERGLSKEDIDSFDERDVFLQDVAAIVKDIQNRTICDSVDKSGGSYFFRYGSVVMKINFKFSP